MTLDYFYEYFILFFFFQYFYIRHAMHQYVIDISSTVGTGISLTLEKF